MDDPTTVNLMVLNEHVAQVLVILTGSQGAAGDTTSGSLCTTFTFYDVNRGELESLENLLAAGISFDNCWGQGDDYPPGTASLRFTPEGEVMEMTVFEGEENPPIDRLLNLLDKPEKLVAYIQGYHNSKTPLPWDNQDEYGKRYLARKLIGL